jgi:hypothetical protein
MFLGSELEDKRSWTDGSKRFPNGLVPLGVPVPQF